MNKMTSKSIRILSSLLLLVGCTKVPSSYEIHYSKGLKDSVVFVNYNFSSDSSNNFYLEYNTFAALFKNKDYDALYKSGAEAIFPPGTVIADAAEKLLRTLNKRLGHASEAAE